MPNFCDYMQQQHYMHCTCTAGFWRLLSDCVREAILLRIIISAHYLVEFIVRIVTTGVNYICTVNLAVTEASRYCFCCWSTVLLHYSPSDFVTGVRATAISVTQPHSDVATWLCTWSYSVISCEPAVWWKVEHLVMANRPLKNSCNQYQTGHGLITGSTTIKSKTAEAVRSNSKLLRMRSNNYWRCEGLTVRSLPGCRCVEVCGLSESAKGYVWPSNQRRQLLPSMVLW